MIRPADFSSSSRRGLGLAVLLFSVCVSHGEFVPLTPVTGVRVVRSSEPYPGGSYEASAAIDGQRRTEYASNGKGTNTFIELEFPAVTAVGAFQFVDRNDPATVAASELVFRDEAGQAVGNVVVSHSEASSRETFQVLAAPISARSVRWRVTALGPKGYATVGAAEIGFLAAGSAEETPSKDRLEAHPTPFLERGGAGGLQPIRFTVSHFYAQSIDAVLRVAELKPIAVTLKPGSNLVEVKLPAAATNSTIPASLEIEGKPITEIQIARKPVRPLTVYILPHSHTDIGYTEIQTDIEKKQVQNLIEGMAHAKRTASYPVGSRFVWNVEVAWAADLYLRRLNSAQRADFLQAVKSGQVSLCGMYLNELTGLCRPEELVQLFRYATQLAKDTGKPIDSVMISDVPGYTWGTVTAMAHAGIKYFSTAPNYFDRIGTILREWENKPFWWVGPDGQSKVLVWIPFWGYAMSHRYLTMSPQLVEDFYDGLEKRGYPYEIAYARWSGHGDNAVPDPSICDFIRDWNAKYVWPHFVISGTSQAFAALEKRYGASLPTVRGDWTPYWEDGAGSSALETALNRQSSDRLVQASSLYAMLQPENYPAAAFRDAWNQVLLYSEHTWGADCSISRPESQKTQEQWDIKQGYARAADQQSQFLLTHALGSGTQQDDWVEVLNTTSWPRTDVVTVSAELSVAGDRVVDASEQPVPSQRLADGRLAFLARDVPTLSGRSFRVVPGTPLQESASRADGEVLDNGILQIRLDPMTGNIIELRAQGIAENLVDSSSGQGLNEYLYLPGDDLNGLKRSGPAKIVVGERGPLVASLIVESEAPGCHRLRREIRLTAGMDFVEVENLVDKARIQASSYHAKEGKESVNFGFPFLVPNGEVTLDLPLGWMRPEVDQMPSACKNWLTIGRWADVSSSSMGVTWVSLDAPLIQLGGLTANLLNSQTDPDVWRKQIQPTQKVYSWAMNNHWGTNYRAYQEGLTRFRFILRPHLRFDPADACRLATGLSQPLLVTPSNGRNRLPMPVLQVSPPEVQVSAFKPSDDGKARIVRLFNASSSPAEASLIWGERSPKALFLSDTSEKAGAPAESSVSIPSRGLVTLRAEF